MGLFDKLKPQQTPGDTGVASGVSDAPVVGVNTTVPAAADPIVSGGAAATDVSDPVVQSTTAADPVSDVPTSAEPTVGVSPVGVGGTMAGDTPDDTGVASTPAFGISQEPVAPVTVPEPVEPEPIESPSEDSLGVTSTPTTGVVSSVSNANEPVVPEVPVSSFGQSVPTTKVEEVDETGEETGSGGGLAGE